ncbi:MAG TPA: protoporphyrinogen oxidase [Burkholderiales bacterium]|nr:protoporphyrinogen oxidase [Burkholderiales bacterium]
MEIDTDVLVIGAGISGLTAAFLLQRKGLRVEVVEAAARVGGVIGTERGQGVLYERGPNSILDTHPRIGELVDTLGLTPERVEANRLASRRYIVRDGRLAPLPTSPPAFLKTSVFSWRSKLRLLREPFVAPAPAGEEESLSHFVERRLGRELLDYAVEPFVAGIYAGNPDELSLPAAFPRLHALEQRYGSLIKGQVLGARERARQSGRSKNTASSFAFRSGMQTLPDAFARAIGSVRTRARATRIRPEHAGRLVVSVEGAERVFEARAGTVVLAVPAYRAAELLREPAPEAARALAEIPYAPVASVALAFARADVAHPLDGFGFLAPRVEKRRILGSLFSSTMFEGRAPDGEVLLTTFVGGRRNPAIVESAEDEIVRCVREELADLAGARGTPRFCGVTRWHAAIPQYTLGHLGRVERAKAAEALVPGLYLCGSYAGGVSVGDCIGSAVATVERITF